MNTSTAESAPLLRCLLDNLPTSWCRIGTRPSVLLCRRSGLSFSQTTSQTHTNSTHPQVCLKFYPYTPCRKQLTEAEKHVLKHNAYMGHHFMATTIGRFVQEQCNSPSIHSPLAQGPSHWKPAEGGGRWRRAEGACRCSAASSACSCEQTP